jgi:hypothetical protein
MPILEAWPKEKLVRLVVRGPFSATFGWRGAAGAGGRGIKIGRLELSAIPGIRRPKIAFVWQEQG